MTIPGIYEIESIEYRDGGIHERTDRVKGRRFRIIRLAGSAPLLAGYVDEADVILRTSSVCDWVCSDERLIVWTRNSVYKFRKVDKEATE